jgi:hypothetical protein
MLSEQNLELLTAFVDGELTRRQRKAVLRLLHRSSQARSILREFQENAHRLRELPHRKLGSAFAGQVLQTIADLGLTPTPEPITPIRRRLPRWVGYAAAASVMFAVGLGIYFANRAPSITKSNSLASLDPKASLPLKVTFKELVQQPKQKLLSQKLQKEKAVHLDMTVRNNAQAVEHLQDVLQNQGIKVLVNAQTNAILKKNDQGKVEYFVYAENVETEELQKILRQLAEGPKNNSALKDTFETLTVTSLSANDRQDLSGLLGVKIADLEEPTRKSAEPLFVDLIEAPKDQIQKKKPAPVPQRERFAMVMAKNAGEGAHTSEEVKKFLAGRQQLRPGTVQVLLVIRQA